MTLRLAWKNTRLHFNKRLPIGLFLVTAMALLFMGNSVFSNTDEGLSATYRNSLTGDLTVSAASEDGFTLFGSDLPLIGEYFKNPVIAQYPDIAYRLSRELPDAKTLPVLIGAGQLSLGKFESVAPFFGAKLDEYLAFFPSLKLERGEVPAKGQPGIYLNSRLYRNLVKELKREPAIGERFLFAASLDNSFVLRELPFEGVFSYPVSDQLLDRVVLIDDDTARALNGYYGSSAVAPDSQTDLMDTGNLEDIFSSSEDVTAVPQDGLTLDSVNAELKNRTAAPRVDPDSWNFVLIRGGGAELSETRETLHRAFARDNIPVQLRDWRDSAGGNAKIVWFLQWIFNVGLAFISLVASLVVMNSLALSVAERTREIGTMRALGAPRSRVGRLIAYETVLLVTGAGIVGIAVGALLLFLVSATGGVKLTNPLVASLFGSERYLPVLSWPLVAWHTVFGLLLGAVSMILPVVRAFQVAPVQAMARE